MLDQLTAGGLVYDRFSAVSDLPNAVAANWIANAPRLTDGKKSLLLTDVPTVADAAMETFSQTVVVDPATQSASQPAMDMDESCCWKLFAQWLAAIDDHTQLAWLHSDWLCRLWDAPIDEEKDQTQEAPPEEDEIQLDDPLPGTEAAEHEVTVPTFRLPQTAAAPRYQITAQDDPDQLFAWMNRYARQIEVLDQVIQQTSEVLNHRRLRWLIAGSSGYSLGENGWVGHRIGPLRSSDIRLPLVLSSGGPMRCGTLVDSNQLPEILQKLHAKQPVLTPQQWAEQDEELSPVVETQSDRAEKAATTASWFYVKESSPDTPAVERLFLKPDDLCDVNDVSRLQPDVVDQLS